MDHGECKHEVHPPFEVIDAQIVSWAMSCFDPVEQSGFPSATPEFHKHLWLHINGYDPSRATDKTCQLHREEAHPGARLDHGHSLGHEGPENGSRVMHEPSEGGCQEIANPPRAYSMRHCS